MKKDSRIYLSGSMNNDLSTDAFNVTEATLKSSGYTNIFNPSSVTYDDARFIGKPSNGFREQMNALTEADVLVLFGNWIEARGCISEVFNAVLFGCEIYTLRITNTKELLLEKLDVNRENVNRIIADLLFLQDQSYNRNQLR
jgi:hypothetical protein